MSRLTVDERLWLIGQAMKSRKLKGWEWGAAKSIMKNCRRPGFPSQKEDDLMCKLVAAQRQPAAASLIDYQDKITRDMVQAICPWRKEDVQAFTSSG